MSDVNDSQTDASGGEDKTSNETPIREDFMVMNIKIRPRRERGGCEKGNNGEGYTHERIYPITLRDFVLGLALAFEFGLGVGALIVRWLLFSR